MTTQVAGVDAHGCVNTLSLTWRKKVHFFSRNLNYRYGNLTLWGYFFSKLFRFSCHSRPWRFRLISKASYTRNLPYVTHTNVWVYTESSFRTKKFYIFITHFNP